MYQSVYSNNKISTMHHHLALSQGILEMQYIRNKTLQACIGKNP